MVLSLYFSENDTQSIINMKMEKEKKNKAISDLICQDQNQHKWLLYLQKCQNTNLHVKRNKFKICTFENHKTR